MQNKFSWSDMANDLINRGIPHNIVKDLADMQLSMLLNRPVFNLIKFDDYLHDKYGKYESQGKSMKDIFQQLFGEDSDKISYYFGIEMKNNIDE